MEKSSILELDEDWEKLRIRVGMGEASPVSLTFILSLGRVVKEEISDDNARLPCFNGRVVSWVRGPAGESLWHCQAPPSLSLCPPPLSCRKLWLFASLPVCLFVCFWPCPVRPSRQGLNLGLPVIAPNRCTARELPSSLPVWRASQLELLSLLLLEPLMLAAAFFVLFSGLSQAPSPFLLFPLTLISRASHIPH